MVLKNLQLNYDIMYVGITLLIRFFWGTVIDVLGFVMVTSSNGNIALLAICAGNSPLPGEFSARRSMTRNFDVFFDLHPNNGWVNHGDAGGLRRYRAHYDVIVMVLLTSRRHVCYINIVSILPTNVLASNGDKLSAAIILVTIMAWFL